MVVCEDLSCPAAPSLIAMVRELKSTQFDTQNPEGVGRDGMWKKTSFLVNRVHLMQNQEMMNTEPHRDFFFHCQFSNRHVTQRISFECLVFGALDFLPSALLHGFDINSNLQRRAPISRLALL